jgi:NAD-dependent dihydropyrimidine dehydrogenase PreA subunit
MVELNFEELKEFIQERKMVTIYDLAFRFEAELDVLRDMLDLLIEKGIISKRQTSSEDKCTSCRSCSSSCSPSIEIYEWVDNQDKEKK